MKVEGPNCKQKILDLVKTHSPSTYRSYELIKNQPDQGSFFEWFLECSESQIINDMATAAHESIHLARYDGEFDTSSGHYYFTNGNKIPAPSDDGFYRPRDIANRLKAEIGIPDGEEFFDTYINATGRDAASSADLFNYLLDELNAYAYDLQVSNEIYSELKRHGHRGSFRSGTAALGSFVVGYVDYAKASAPETWQRLNSNLAQTAVTQIWGQVEAAFNRFCSHSDSLGADDLYYFKYLCKAEKTAALSQLIGRNVECPQKCIDQKSGANVVSKMGPPGQKKQSETGHEGEKCEIQYGDSEPRPIACKKLYEMYPELSYIY